MGNAMKKNSFTITIEVVPPAGPDALPLLSSLRKTAELPIDGFSVATNPVAKPRMNAMALCSLIQQTTGQPAILHCTIRDQNRLSLQAMLWGAKALGIETVLVATGDFVALDDKKTTSDVRDVDVFKLISMARETGLRTGVVFDIRPETNGLKRETERLKRKCESGAQFAVTQPIYDKAGVDIIYKATRDIGVPVVMGILPLRTFRHAEFLHNKVAGIEVPESVRQRMQQAKDTVAEGAANARDMMRLARERFAGACVMPPFDHYEVLSDVLI
jgi:homocysteine S-methyltransferase